MIHEAKVKFHTFDIFNFTRKQDARNIKLEEEIELYVMVDRHYVSFLFDK